MHSSIWGKHAWYLLHTIAFNFPITPTNIQVKQYIIFFNILKVLIPCPICKRHYQLQLLKMPAESNCNSRHNITTWINNIHNTVNIGLGKKQISLENSLKMFSDKNGKLIINHNKIHKFIDILISINNPNNIKSIKILLNTLCTIFPCEICKKYLNKSIDIYNLSSVNNSHSLIKWYNNIKNWKSHKVPSINDSYVIVLGQRYDKSKSVNTVVWDKIIKKYNINYTRIYKTYNRWILFNKYLNKEKNKILYINLQTQSNYPPSHGWIKV